MERSVGVVSVGRRGHSPTPTARPPEWREALPGPPRVEWWGWLVEPRSWRYTAGPQWCPIERSVRRPSQARARSVCPARTAGSRERRVAEEASSPGDEPGPRVSDEQTESEVRESASANNTQLISLGKPAKSRLGLVIEGQMVEQWGGIIEGKLESTINKYL